MYLSEFRIIFLSAVSSFLSDFPASQLELSHSAMSCIHAAAALGNKMIIYYKDTGRNEWVAMQ